MDGLAQAPRGRLLTGSTAIEVLSDSIERGRIRHALFDFDGTLSLIRSGWVDVMVPMMVEVLRATPDAEDEATLRPLVRDWVDTLTGKQTIYQMIRLAEEVAQRGGTPREPLAYKHDYLDRLWQRVRWRVDGLRDGSLTPDDLMVPGSRALLTHLRAHGIVCTLASGTDLPCVQAEAEALGLTAFFDGGIHGALDEYQRFSKAMTIQRILADHDLRGPELVGFGDGYVEIENTVEVGGLAVGAATDEARRAGIDAWKRDRLAAAGAHVIVPDWREHGRLVAWLRAEEE